MSLYSLDRVHLPSAIRRGRLAVQPTWIVVGPGIKRQFMRKRDAIAFIHEAEQAERIAPQSAREAKP